MSVQYPSAYVYVPTTTTHGSIFGRAYSRLLHNQFSSVQSLDRLGHGGGGDMTDDSAKILFQSFLQETTERFWYGRECPLIEVAHPAFPLLITALPTLQGALKDGFGETVMAFDVPEPCKFPFQGICQKTFVWTHKELDLALHLAVVPVLPSRRCGEVSSCTWFQKPGSFFSIRKQGFMFHSRRGG